MEIGKVEDMRADTVCLLKNVEFYTLDIKNTALFQELCINIDKIVVIKFGWSVVGDYHVIYFFNCEVEVFRRSDVKHIFLSESAYLTMRVHLIGIFKCGKICLNTMIIKTN